MNLPDGPGGLAVSGGSDSMAMLHLAASPGVHVLHVDHGLRADSGSDAAFVAEQARSLGFQWSVLRAGVQRLARSSPEDAARRLRYRLLDTAARELNLTWIATAHTVDDQAETALLRTIRGSGAAGIPRQRGIYIRPLIDRRRDELRAWLEERQISWRDDPSNTDTGFERNWVRHDLLPLIALRRPGAASALARAATNARDDEEYLRALARSLVGRPGVHGVRIGAAERPLQRRAIAMAVASLGLDPDHRTVDALLSGRRAAHVVRIADGDGIRLVSTRTSAPDAVAIEDAEAWGLRVRIGGHGPAGWWRCSISEGGWRLRSRRPGDRVQTNAGTRKVSDVFIDAKVPRVLRDRVPVLAKGEDAIAVVGITSPPDLGGVIVDLDPMEDWWQRSTKRSS